MADMDLHPHNTPIGGYLTDGEKGAHLITNADVPHDESLSTYITDGGGAKGLLMSDTEGVGSNLPYNDSLSAYLTEEGTRLLRNASVVYNDSLGTYITNGTGEEALLMSDVEGLGSNPRAAGEVIHEVALPVVCAVGAAGLALTIVVLSRKNMSTSTNCYLLALAAADLCYLLLIGTSLAVHTLQDGSQAHFRFLLYWTPAAIFVDIFLLASVWLMVMLAVERYIAICRPFYAQRICTVRRARIIIVVIYLAAAIARAPNFFEHQLRKVYDTSENRTVWYMEVTELAVRPSYVQVYPWVVDVALTTVVPFTTLVALNLQLILAVRRSTAYLKRHSIVSHSSAGRSAARREELQVTSMLISVIVVFFLCQAPYVLYTALSATRRLNILSPSFMVFRYVTMLLLMLKAAINFILYCWFSERFLDTLRKMLLLHYCHKLPPRRDVSAVTCGRRRSSAATHHSCV